MSLDSEKGKDPDERLVKPNELRAMLNMAVLVTAELRKLDEDAIADGLIMLNELLKNELLEKKLLYWWKKNSEDVENATPLRLQYACFVNESVKRP